MDIQKLAGMTVSRGRVLARPIRYEDVSWHDLLWLMEKESQYITQLHEVILCGELVEDIRPGDLIIIRPHALSLWSEPYETYESALFFIHEDVVLAVIRGEG